MKPQRLDNVWCLIVFKHSCFVFGFVCLFLTEKKACTFASVSLFDNRHCQIKAVLVFGVFDDSLFDRGI